MHCQNMNDTHTDYDYHDSALTLNITICQLYGGLVDIYNFNADFDWDMHNDDNCLWSITFVIFAKAKQAPPPFSTLILTDMHL